ncbi:Reverse transcriptase zinc-binding domain [Arabidopsis suecica]|uniref:Reverse transcriptase zinc-binding domain n=1 Tax=Arabidopsis suecica TaxID=45249 RepID=A0A8T1Z946_ARASU|nr:Reverse transcriptase zinc-binding domain [Arabidopsis suecica]
MRFDFYLYVPLVHSHNDDRGCDISINNIQNKRNILITKIKPVVSSQDFWIWHHNKSGEYSVRSGYWLASRDQNYDLYQAAAALPSLNPIKDLIWTALAPSKIKVFMWKAISGAIPVTEKLASRGISLDQRCQICGFEGESINHLLFICTLARQVWALADIPSPENGFDGHSIYHNLHYILKLAKSSSVQDMIGKIKEDAVEWFLAQQIEEEETVKDIRHSAVSLPSWRPPDRPWLKCNLASTWDRVNRVGGAAWVLRNSSGVVLLHSRKSFALVDSKDEVDLQCWLWTIESMFSLKIRYVCFAVEACDLLQAVCRPAAWPSFKLQAELVSKALDFIPFWKLRKEDRKANKGALLIAKSVTLEDRRQSYVASGYPFWLKELFTEEMCVA